jgi:hypothetical protein
MLNGEPLSIKNASIEEIFNSEPIRKIRLTMLETTGWENSPPECYRCRHEESVGALSKRITSNRNHEDLAERWEQTKEDGSLPLQPVAINLPTANLCNSLCRSCQPKFSSAIAAAVKNKSVDRRWKKYVPKEDLRAAPSTSEYLKKMDFLSSSLPDILDTIPHLRQLWLYGGEPTISPYFKPLVEKVYSSGNRIQFGFTTNLTSTSWLRYFENPSRPAVICFSFDGVGPVYEYARYPGKWKNIDRNIRVLLQQKHLTVMPCITIGALNVGNFPKIIAYLNEVFTEAQRPLEFRMNLIQSPKQLRIEALPKALREKFRRELEAENFSRFQAIPPTTGGAELLGTMVTAILNRLSTNEDSEQDFFEFNLSLDIERNQDLSAAIPELREYIAIRTGQPAAPGSA